MAIRKLQDGRYELSAYIKRWRLRRYYDDLKTAEDLQAKIRYYAAMGREDELLEELRSPVEESYTVEKFYSERFVPEWAKPRLRSARRYDLSFRRIQAKLGREQLGDFNLRHLAEYVSDRTGDKPATVNRDIAFLKSLFSYAMRLGLVDANPIGKYPLLQVQREEREIPKGTEYHALQAILAQKNAVLGALVAVAGECGLRRSELLQLEWGHVDFRERCLTVTGRTKSRKSRRVPLSSFAIDQLGRIVRRLDQKRVFWPWQNPDKILRRHGIKLHALRHFRATEWLRNGVPIHYVRDWLGHSSISVTEIYLRYIPDQATEAFARAERIELERMQREVANG